MKKVKGTDVFSLIYAPFVFLNEAKEKAVRCTITSLSAFALDFVILIVLVNYFSVWYLLAAGISFIFAHSLEYYVNKKYIFHIKDVQIKRYMTFLSFEIISLCLLILLMKLFVEYFGIVYWVSRIIISLFIGAFLFVMNYLFTFKKN